MKLYVFGCGRIWVERGFLLHYGTKKDTGKAYVAEALPISNCQYFIDTGKKKIIFDLGWSPEEFAILTGFPHRKGAEGMFMKQEPSESPIARLKELGYNPGDIDYVVSSHLMLEHAAYLPAFAGTKAQIVVQEQEYEYAQRIGTYNPPDALPFALEQFHSWMYYRKHFDIPGLNYLLIKGDEELVKDVNIIHNYGHTPGYQIMSVKLPKSGFIALAPCESLTNYYEIPVNGAGPGIPHGVTYFAAAELASFKKTRELVAKEEGQLFGGHDWEQYSKKLKKSPEYYE